MLKNLIILTLIISTTIGCYKKKKKNAPDKPKEKMEIENPSPIPDISPTSDIKKKEGVNPDPKKATKEIKYFTVSKCLAKFWTYDLQYYSLIAINPSVGLELTDVIINNQSIQNISSFPSNVSIANIINGNVDILSEVNKYRGNIQPWFNQVFPNGLVFFAKQHNYIAWSMQNIKFVIGDQELDLSTVCPPLPYLPPAYGDPTYKSVVLYWGI